jgi:hypothetical protein
MYYGHTNVPLEIELAAQRPHDDPFNDVDVDVDFVGPDGTTWRVPAFWDGGDVFRTRFAAPIPGRYTFRSVASDDTDPGLHGRAGELEIAPYAGRFALYQHGRIRVAPNRRTFEHADGSPFFWLGDTQWQGCTSRLDWPHGFAHLESDRQRKGFSVVQIVVGPLSGFDVHESWHPHQANEGGCPWEEGWTRINPRFYDVVDRKIEGLVEHGLVPCVVGMWGYYLNLMGLERTRRHWRYLVARYGAFPVVWCLAGEVQMPMYSVGRAGGEQRIAAMAEQADGWSEVGRLVRRIDPNHNLVTTHPAALGDDPQRRAAADTQATFVNGSSRSVLTDPSVVDFDMLQSGHHGFHTMEPCVRQINALLSHGTDIPVVEGEVNYEGITGTCWQDVQRFHFWTAATDGVAGYTYGAAGLWAMWSLDEYCKGGESDLMEDAGGGPWQEVMHLPGSTQVGIGRRLFEQYPWWRFERRVEPAVEALGRPSAFGTGIPGAVAIYYVPSGLEPEAVRGIHRAGDWKYFWWRHSLPITIEPGAHYTAAWFDPRSGERTPIGPVTADPEGRWTPPSKPSLLDWVLVLENREQLARLAPSAPASQS